MDTMEQHEDLKTKVFKICENLYNKDEKITREKVRELLGGGSYSTISPLVTEWKKLKSVQLDSPNSIGIENESTEASTESNLVLSHESEITDSLGGETITAQGATRFCEVGEKMCF
ncbi:DNA-binding protein [Anabaena cylindrica UHCC 0172]|uniref:DNA-binding protein n=1 Tax=Anabaena cylindrica TaxID=1165 RepID=UPI002B1EF940|nr:DNA-binding protein [Anabaena cylindrica]MEA5554388.1 DNA-binding protein [Anabaena cylindrica UHCC 0172]